MNLKSIFQSYGIVKVKKEAYNLIFSIFRFAFLFLVGYIVLYPLLYMISTAIKTEADFLDVSHQWIPIQYTMENFKVAFSALDFFNSLKKTLTIQIFSAVIETFVCSFIAYGFARFNFKGKKVATFILILSLLIPVQMYSLSLSVNYRMLNIFNTPLVYWLPSIFGIGIRSGMIIFIYQQFFIGLPKELEDAAYVDGAGPIKTFFRIALPSSSVVIVTVSVLSLIWHWNEYYLAELCFMDEVRPLSVAIGHLTARLAQIGINTGHPLYTAAVCAGCLLFVAIPLVFYMIIQRKFVRSIDRVGITG